MIGALFPQIEDDLAKLKALWNEFDKTSQDDALTAAVTDFNEVFSQAENNQNQQVEALIKQKD